MNRYWNLREELYQTLHRWPVMLLSILVGALFGLGLSWLWPAHYRATSELYIALNPYRKFEDTIFEALANPKYSNLDNYQYWQMSQLQGAIYLDSFLQPTLDKLRQQDPYWNNVDIASLRNMLSDEWRTTGVWSMIANHSNAKLAEQAAQAWSKISMTKIAECVEAARRTFMVDQKMQSASDERLQASIRQKELMAAGEALQKWLDERKDVDPDKPIAANARWELLALVSGLAKFTPGWMQILDNQPPEDAALWVYQEWIAQLKPYIEQEIAAMGERVVQMDSERITLAQKFAIEQRASLSFSPNIEVQKRLDRATKVIRPTSTMIMVGAMIGFLAWLIAQLVRISNLRRHE